jgi:LPXTG-motif cell wall-anchored protein
VTVSFTVPTDLPAGAHTLDLVDSAGRVQVLPLTLAPPARRTTSGTLAYTGADVTLPVVLGGALVLAGGAVLVGTRRRGATGARP